MDIYLLLKTSVKQGASDLHLCVGAPALMRKNGELVPLTDEVLASEDTRRFTEQLLTEQQQTVLQKKGEIDLAYSLEGIGRFRINAFKQKGVYSIAIRILSSQIPDFESLGLPPAVRELTKRKRGLILVTGPTGSGKSTTLACMIDMINSERSAHIITLEDPIEYVHHHKRSIVSQREIGSDTASFAGALRASLRQDPDVILIGEMRDRETISIALTAAETGHLVLSTLHTVGAAKTVDRIIDVFPPHQQQQIRLQLSMVLEGVISQQLVPTVDRSARVAAVEIMIVTPAIRNLIREGKSHQIGNVIQTSARYGMKTMDQALLELYRKGLISRQDALSYSVDRQYMSRLL